MVVSQAAEKKQHAFAFSVLRNHYSELYTWMIHVALEFESAVTQPL